MTVRLLTLVRAEKLVILLVVADITRLEVVRSVPPTRIVPGGLIEKGGLLVKPKAKAEVTQRQVDAAASIEDDRLTRVGIDRRDQDALSGPELAGQPRGDRGAPLIPRRHVRPMSRQIADST